MEGNQILLAVSIIGFVSISPSSDPTSTQPGCLGTFSQESVDE